MPYTIHYDLSRFGELDIYLFKRGEHTRLYEKMGAHMMEREGVRGVYFAVWAPNAACVSVEGDFNAYDPHAHPLKLREDGSGIWEGFIESVEAGETYKYYIESKIDGIIHHKADPYAFWSEKPPKSASRVWMGGAYNWQDAAWMQKRHANNAYNAPVSIYEVHLGSWRRKVEEGNRPLTYREAAQELAKYLVDMGYTHVELLPITEYPFEGSWGYQVTGYFAPTARYGTPEDFMAFVDTMHAHGIGVILDWVPSHFVTDGHGLINFDGTCLYEHADPRLGYHPEWGSAIFNYGRNEVRSFLISSAHFWLDRYHIDGIRVDAVASMLYLNYAREDGEWLPNKYGGNENLEAIAFIRQLNTSVFRDFPDVMMVAEESTAWPMVTRPVDVGGLGFTFKWNMGWMHDSLKYFKTDPIYRQYHHDQLTFSIWYAFDEQFVLPLSHDEVVHMKGSLINKMAGDENQKFANLRALFAYMMAHPGKKLLFMGGEFAQWAEWNYQQSLDWHLLSYERHRGIQRLVADLNRLYREQAALYLYDEKHQGFAWIDYHDVHHNVIAFERRCDDPKESVVVVCNFSDQVLEGYRIGVPYAKAWTEIFNSQYRRYGGWDITNPQPLRVEEVSMHGYAQSIVLRLPPLGVVYFKQVEK